MSGAITAPKGTGDLAVDKEIIAALKDVQSGKSVSLSSNIAERARRIIGNILEGDYPVEYKEGARKLFTQLKDDSGHKIVRSNAKLSTPEGKEMYNVSRKDVTKDLSSNFEEAALPIPPHIATKPTVFQTRLSAQDELQMEAQQQAEQRRQAEQAEQRRQAEQKAEQRRRAEQAEQRRKAEQAEQRRKAEQAEQRRKAEQAEQRRQAEQAEQRRKAEQAEQRRQAEQAEQRRQAEQIAEQRRQAEQAEQRRQTEQAEQRRRVAQQREFAQQQAAVRFYSPPSFFGYGNGSVSNTSFSGSFSGSYHSSGGRANGSALFTGPRGGTYYINSNGNKTYV